MSEPDGEYHPDFGDPFCCLIWSFVGLWCFFLSLAIGLAIDHLLF